MTFPASGRGPQRVRTRLRGRPRKVLGSMSVQPGVRSPARSTSSSSARVRPGCSAACGWPGRASSRRRGSSFSTRTRPRRRLAAPLAVADRRDHPPGARPARPAFEPEAGDPGPATSSPRTSPPTSAVSGCRCTGRCVSLGLPHRRDRFLVRTDAGDWTARAMSTPPAPGPVRSFPAIPARNGSAAASCTPPTTAPRRSSPAGTWLWSAAACRPSAARRDLEGHPTTWVTRRPPVGGRPLRRGCRADGRSPGRGGRARAGDPAASSASRGC